MQPLEGSATLNEPADSAQVLPISRRFSILRRKVVAQIAGLPQPLLFSVSLVVLLALWEFIVRTLDVPFWILPPPSRIAVTLGRGFWIDPTSRASYLYHWVYTMGEAAIGYLIGSSIGLICGTAIAQNRLAEKVLFPYLVGLQSMPKMAIAPLLIVWFGLGIESKVALVVLVTSFPVLISSINGFESVESERIELMRSLCATPWQIFSKVRVPSALPYIFTGLDIAVVSSVLASVIAEFVGGQRGLGVYLLLLKLNLDTAGVFAVLLILSLTGVGLHLLVVMLRRRIVFWLREESVGS